MKLSQSVLNQKITVLKNEGYVSLLDISRKNGYDTYNVRIEKMLPEPCRTLINSRGLRSRYWHKSVVNLVFDGLYDIAQN